MQKPFYNLFISIFIFSLLFNLQKSFAASGSISVTNNCTETSATFTRSVITSADLTISEYPLCVNDADAGQNVTVTASTGTVSGGTVTKDTVPSGKNETLKYSVTFSPSDIFNPNFTKKPNPTIGFNVDDRSSGSNLVAQLIVDFTSTPIYSTHVVDNIIDSFIDTDTGKMFYPSIS